MTVHWFIYGKLISDRSFQLPFRLPFQFDFVMVERFTVK